MENEPRQSLNITHKQGFAFTRVCVTYLFYYPLVGVVLSPSSPKHLDAHLSLKTLQ